MVKKKKLNKKTKRSNAGRKNVYNTKIEPNLARIKGWCRDGLTDKEIGRRIGVSLASFYKYKNIKTESWKQPAPRSITLIMRKFFL